MRPITLLHDGTPSPAARATLDRLARLDLVAGGIVIESDPGSSESVASAIRVAGTPWLLQLASPHEVDPGPHALDRMLAAAEASGAAMVYGDRVDIAGAQAAPHPLADCQGGSISERFEFGPLRLWSVDVLRAAAERDGLAPGLRRHAWYDLRLRAGRRAPIVRLPEPLCSVTKADSRSSGQAVFDYLLADREAQVEAERVATAHLEAIGSAVHPPFLEVEAGGEVGSDASEGGRCAPFPVEASVVIPVRDRARTVGDAVRSALDQRASFPFNVIVVDNHSTDGTSAILAGLAAGGDRLVHVVPSRRDLGIGGCWNEAVFHPACGRYACQLDSDDLYDGQDVLQRIVTALRDLRCGMLIGSYTTVDFGLSPLPPGLIDHREWTPDNGPNNALRLEGLGAPRCFATRLLRRDPFPNASYGEDYAVALRVCREYRVGRIMESLYWCRRWEDNTDAALSPERVARNQAFKDRIRTLEIAARRRLNESREVDG